MWIAWAAGLIRILDRSQKLCTPHVYVLTNVHFYGKYCVSNMLLLPEKAFKHCTWSGISPVDKVWTSLVLWQRLVVRTVKVSCCKYVLHDTQTLTTVIVNRYLTLVQSSRLTIRVEPCYSSKWYYSMLDESFRVQSSRNNPSSVWCMWLWYASA